MPLSEQRSTVQFEERDISIRGVLITGIGVLVATLLIVFAM